MFFNARENGGVGREGGGEETQFKVKSGGTYIFCVFKMSFIQRSAIIAKATFLSCYIIISNDNLCLISMRILKKIPNSSILLLFVFSVR